MFVLRFLFGTVVLCSLTACSTSPLETSLPNSMRVASKANNAGNRPKTLSSDILSDIALERVTGKRSPEVTLAQLAIGNTN
ncbi:MAG: hypothetical protein ACI89J_001356 [Hyphomicrobiaceae bacterium]|jgi:hypothetical protein